MDTQHIDTNLKILIVDNDKNRIRSLKSMLKNLDYRNIEEDTNCDHALSLLDEVSEHRLIFLNWDIGEGVTMKFVEDVRQGFLKDTIKIIMETDRSDQNTILKAIKAGVNRCIIKPVLPKTIEHELLQIMEGDLAAAKNKMEESVELARKEMLSEEKEKEKIAKVYLEGVNEMLLALEFYPWKAFAHYQIGLAYQKARMESRAVSSLEKALKLEDNHKQGCHALAGIFLHRRQWHKVIRLLAPFVAKKPFPDMLGQLGEAYLATGEINKAIKAFNDSIFYNKETTTTSNKRELAKKHEGLGKAFQERELAKKHEGLGKAYQEKADETGDEKWQERSIDQFETSIGIDPTLVSAHLNLVQAYKQSGQQEKAAQILKNAASITPNDSEGWVSLGNLYLQEDAPDKASFAFKRAIQVTESPQQTFYDIAESYTDRDIALAVRFLKRSVQLDSKQPHVWNKLGIINRRKGDVDEALEDYKHALELDPGDEIIHFNYAYACLDKNEGNFRQEAITHLTEALRLRPDFEEVKVLLKKLQPKEG